MKKNLEDYIKIYKNSIDKDTCDLIIKELDKVSWSQHKFYSSAGLVDHGKEPFEYLGKLSIDNKIKQIIWNSLKKYILDDINFEWFPGWSNFSNIKFIKYPLGSEMTNHCDHIHSLFDGINKGIPVLTIIGLLNDEFDGGNLIMFDDQLIKLEAGDIIIFPSIFLYPHKISMVTNGTRYSFVSWSY